MSSGKRPTRVARKIADLRAALAPARGYETVGLVPTMGALHAGHRALIRRSRAACDITVVTLFVNPTQFNQAADLERYPRTFDADLSMCEEEGVDWLFTPAVEEMYPEPGLTTVEVAGLTDGLCGAHRPGHFRGVATVVAKLLLIALPDRAYFGEKDYQQLAVIRRMVRDLNIPSEIVGVETVRESDGLALSSRNALLTKKARRAASAIPRALGMARELVRGGETAAAVIAQSVRETLAAETVLEPEYVELIDPETLEPVERVETGVRLAVAVWADGVRLIDNGPLVETELTGTLG